MNRATLEMMLQRIELTNATEPMINAAETNEMLEALGGKPICINQEDARDGRGSRLDSLGVYALLLIIKGLDDERRGVQQGR